MENRIGKEQFKDVTISSWEKLKEVVTFLTVILLLLKLFANNFLRRLIVCLNVMVCVETIHCNFGPFVLLSDE